MGLSIIGVASESEESTDPWIEETKAKYAYAFDHSSKLMRAVGASGYPSAILVNPRGEIVFSGHPAKVDDEMIEDALEGALLLPVYAWPEDLKKAKEAFRAGDLGTAIVEAEATDKDYIEIVEALVEMIPGRIDLMDELKEQGDYLRVVEIGEGLKKAIEEGDDMHTRVSDLVRSIEKDRDMRVVYKAQQKIQKIFAKKVKKKQVPKLIKDLEKLRDKHPDTIIDRDVDRAIARLRLVR